MGRGHSLEFVTKVFTPTKSGWTPDMAIKLTTIIQSKMKNAGGFKWNPALATKETGMSKSGCCFMLKELKLAANEGWTVEQYFAKGRPFRYGKKVLA